MNMLTREYFEYSDKAKVLTQGNPKKNSSKVGKQRKTLLGIVEKCEDEEKKRKP